MRYEGVVFDLDHTLFDRYATLTAITPDFCLELKEYIKPGLDHGTVARLLCEGDSKYIYYGWRRIFAELCEAGLFDPPPQYDQYRQALLRLFTKYAIPLPYTYSVLDELRGMGLKLGLITNGDGTVQAAKLKLLKLESAFDATLLCGDFGVQKPAREPFDEAARLLGIPCEKLLYVGDNPVCDIEGARNGGYTPVQVLTAECILPDAVPAKLQIKNVSELPGLVRSLQD